MNVIDISTQHLLKYTWHDELTLCGETAMNNHERQRIAYVE